MAMGQKVEEEGQRPRCGDLGGWGATDPHGDWPVPGLCPIRGHQQRLIPP